RALGRPRAAGLAGGTGRLPGRTRARGGRGGELLACGGAGFIGSSFVRRRLRDPGDEVVVLDKLTYAGREENLAEVQDEPGLTFLHGAIEDRTAVAEAIEGCDAVVNF